MHPEQSNTLYALNGFGITKSTDGLAVDPVNPERLYVGTFRNSVYASGDSGQTWR